jgi:serine/threonine protein kinase
MFLTPSAGRLSPGGGTGLCFSEQMIGVFTPTTLRFMTASTSSGEDCSSVGNSAETDDDEFRIPTPPPFPIEFERFLSAESCSEDLDNSCSTNLNYFHCEARLEQLLSNGAFTKVQSLGECSKGEGEVEIHKWDRVSDAKVVVKRVPMSFVNANKESEPDERAVHLQGCKRQMEDALTEIGIYCYLRRQQASCEYLLKMHQAFACGSDAWTVLEHADGGDLYDVIEANQGKTPLRQAIAWTGQLLQAVDFLHKHFIGHRDISIENILLHGGNVRLMDFGQAVQTHSAAGTPLRYFCALGKGYYRAPERYVPTETGLKVEAPAGSNAGDVAFVTHGEYMCEVLLSASSVAFQECTAEPCGYTVPPADVFSCGVILFILATGRPPWEQAKLADPHFDYVQRIGLAALLRSYQSELPPDAVDLLAAMVEANPMHRPSAAECLVHPGLLSHQ